jgi:hypothetical protein
LFLASAEAAEAKFLSRRTYEELRNAKAIISIHATQEVLFVLRQVPGAAEAAEQVRHAASLYSGLVERLREDEGGRLPEGLEEFFRKERKQLDRLWFSIVPERLLWADREPLGARAGPRARLFFALVGCPDLFGTLTATEMMCLALISNLRTDSPTTDRDEYRRRLEAWRKVMAACRENCGGSANA